MSRRPADFVVHDEMSISDAELQRRINLDQKLIALKQLRDLQVDPVKRLEIQDMIDKRVAEHLATS